MKVRMFLKLSVMASLLMSLAYLTGCAAAGALMKADPVLNKEDIAKLAVSPSEACLIFGGFTGITYGTKDTINVVMNTSSDSRTVKPAIPSMTSSVIPFVFAGVPKGDFSISWIMRDGWTGKKDWMNNNEMVKTTFGTPPTGEQKSSKMGGHGDIHNDMKGKCDGGFIWLGFYTITPGGMLSSSKLERKTSLEYYDKDKYLNSIREQVKGTAWEAAIRK